MTFAVSISAADRKPQGGIAHRLRVKAAGGGNAYMQQRLDAQGQPRAAMPQRRMAEWQAQHHARFRIGDGEGLYLARDGQSLTDCSRAAWFGSEEQLCNALLCFPLAAGLKPLRTIDKLLPQRAAIRHLGGAE